MKIPLQARPRELLRCEKEARTRVREAPEAPAAYTARAARPCPGPARAWKAVFHPARRAAAHDNMQAPDTVSSTALCGLGKSAPNPVVSTIKNFRDEYEAHIFEKRCPTGNCARLKRIVIDPAVCKGCSKCARQCPAGAISGELKSPFHIDLTKCLRCGACITACPFHAIREE